VILYDKDKIAYASVFWCRPVNIINKL
jgi:hypothetical protein